MTQQFSDDVRDARVAAIQATIGPSPTLELWTGAAPVNCAAPNSGLLLATQVLPAVWLSAPVAGVVTKVGVWSGPILNNGVVGHYRFKVAGACKSQGAVTDMLGAGPMRVSDVNFIAGLVFRVVLFTETEGGA